MSRRRGTLSVVGLGFQGVAHLNAETEACLDGAEVLFVLASDEWLRRRYPHAIDLFPLYGKASGELGRLASYEAMIDRLLAAVRAGKHVTAAFYGHPGVFAYPPHEAIRRARAEGYRARMLPSISAEDCMIADLGFDPGGGCQSFEATALLVFGHRIDPSSHLLVWQFPAVGQLGYPLKADAGRLQHLVDHLARFDPLEHRVTSYLALPYPVARHSATTVPLGELAEQSFEGSETLHVPPLPRRDPDPEMCRKLGLDADVVRRIYAAVSGKSGRRR